MIVIRLFDFGTPLNYSSLNSFGLPAYLPSGTFPQVQFKEENMLQNALLLLTEKAKDFAKLIWTWLITAGIPSQDAQRYPYQFTAQEIIEVFIKRLVVLSVAMLANSALLALVIAVLHFPLASLLFAALIGVLVLILFRYTAREPQQ
ncbi:MAG TPA: hypothetical protein VF762_20940, partial [Blastocatellia bacterium]|jgi:hypothetical protein